MPKGAELAESRPSGSEQQTTKAPVAVVIDPAELRRALSFSQGTNSIDNPLFSPHSGIEAWNSLPRDQVIPAALASLVAFRAHNPLTGCIEENPQVLPPIGILTDIILSHQRSEKDKTVALLCALNYPITTEVRRSLGSAIVEAYKDGLLPLELTKKVAERLAIKLTEPHAASLPG